MRPTNMNPPINGRFGQLVVLGLGGSTERTVREKGRKPRVIEEFRWRCVCDCGNSVDVWPSNLRSGRSQTCGHTQDRMPRGHYPRTCTAEGCDGPHATHGYCRKHAARWAHRKRIGSTVPVTERMIHVHPHRIDIDAILALPHLNDSEVARELGYSKSSVSAHRRRLGIPVIRTNRKKDQS